MDRPEGGEEGLSRSEIAGPILPAYRQHHSWLPAQGSDTDPEAVVPFVLAQPAEIDQLPSRMSAYSYEYAALWFVARPTG